MVRVTRRGGAEWEEKGVRSQGGQFSALALVKKNAGGRQKRGPGSRKENKNEGRGHCAPWVERRDRRLFLRFASKSPWCRHGSRPAPRFPHTATPPHRNKKNRPARRLFFLSPFFFLSLAPRPSGNLANHTRALCSSETCLEGGGVGERKEAGGTQRPGAMGVVVFVELGGRGGGGSRASLFLAWAHCARFARRREAGRAGEQGGVSSGLVVLLPLV